MTTTLPARLVRQPSVASAEAEYVRSVLAAALFRILARPYGREERALANAAMATNADYETRRQS